MRPAIQHPPGNRESDSLGLVRRSTVFALLKIARNSALTKS